MDETDSTGEDLLHSCLPLPLEDLCLLEVINDIDGFPVELLASLPVWLRYRLLNNLPVLDLCRLEHSTIARGFDLGVLWDSRWETPRIPHPRYQPPLSNTIRSDLHYRIKDVDCLQYLEPELVSAFQKISNVWVDPKQKYLLQVASDVLDSTEYETNVKALTIVPADWLISMKGDRLLQDVTDAEHNPHQARSSITFFETSTSRRNRSKVAAGAYKTIWGSQTTALARYEQEDIRLAPHRLLPIRERSDPLELLSLLVHECGLEPLSIAHLGLTRMTNSQEWTQCMKDREKLKEILRHILHKVIILGIQCDHVSQPEIVSRIVMEAVLANGGENCHLKYLFIPHITQAFMTSLSPHFNTLPGAKDASLSAMQGYRGLSVVQLGLSDLEPGLYISALLKQQPQLKCVQLDFDCGRDGIDAFWSNAVQLFSTLSSLFSQPQFKFMKLDLKKECIIPSSLLQSLLCGFMRAPCEAGEQQLLTITSEYSSPSVFSQKEIELASVEVSSGGTIAVHDCGIQHKKLSLTSNLQSVVGNLLQLSTIRVNKIHFDCHDDRYPYLHQAALHPDLQVMGIRLYFQFCPFEQLLTTVESDLISCLTKPSLTEISVLGYWNLFEEIKSAVEKALHKRAEVGAIRKLILSAPITNSMSFDDRKHSKEQLLALWHSIFSLPHLEDLEVVIGGDICKITLENKESIYETWKQTASGRKIKTLELGKYLITDESEGLLREITENLVISTKML